MIIFPYVNDISNLVYQLWRERIENQGRFERNVFVKFFNRTDRTLFVIRSSMNVTLHRKTCCMSIMTHFLSFLLYAYFHCMSSFMGKPQTQVREITGPTESHIAPSGLGHLQLPHWYDCVCKLVDVKTFDCQNAIDPLPMHTMKQSKR